MNIGMVTTWGADCGISTYSEQLVAHLQRQVNVTVLSENVQGTGVSLRTVPGDVSVHQVWSRRMLGNADALAAIVQQRKLDIVHIQHEDGLFPGFVSDFIEMIHAAQNAGAKVIVTLHTARWRGGLDDRPGMYRRVLEAADVVVVHTREALAALTTYKGELVCIPHGTPAPREGDPQRGLQILDVRAPGGRSKLWRNGLIFGFVGAGKNIECTIGAFAEGITRGYINNNVRLIVCGAPQRGSEAYIARLCYLVAYLGFEDRVYIRQKFIPVVDVPHVFALANFGVLNTVSQTLSASGQVHQYAAYGVPLAVANRPIYYEAIRAGAIPFALGPEPTLPTASAVNAIAALAMREDHDAWAVGMFQLATRTDWKECVVPQLVSLYKKVLGHG